jgi:hypothetical protein
MDADGGPVNAVKNLMYGFGDDRNPANDTVNVMEEILIEYITDVVRPFVASLPLSKMLTSCYLTVPDGDGTFKESAFIH